MRRFTPIAASTAMLLLAAYVWQFARTAHAQQDSSPIIITDGSIHFRQYRGDVALAGDDRHAAITAKNGYQAHDVYIGNCTNGSVYGNCSGQPKPSADGLVGQDWSLTLYNGNAPVVRITPANAGSNAIRLEALVATHEFRHETGSGDGPGVQLCRRGAACDVRLTKAALVVGGASQPDLLCPSAAAGKACTIYISYR